MPKMKNRKSLMKRVKITQKGGLLRRHVQTSHLRSGESVGTRRRKGELTTFSKSFQRKLKKLISL